MVVVVVLVKGICHRVFKGVEDSRKLPAHREGHP
jgi:hypothetical protein